LLDDLPRIEGGMRQLPLPDVPEKVIRYRTHVEPCDGTQGETTPHLSVAVRSTNLGFETFQHLRAVYNRTVMAVAQEGEPYPVLDVQVVPGEYEVAVRPPSDSPCGVLVAQVTPVENGQSLVLEPASVITGRLYREDRASGERVGIAGASLDASALANAEVGMHHRSSQAMTDTDGFFTLFVDRGRYDVVARPVLGMGFGWQLLHDVEIASHTCGPHGDADGQDCVVLHSEIRLDAPIPVSGQLRFEGAADGGTASWGPSGATVTAYVMTDNDDENGRPVPIATATSDGEGRFRLLLSPSIRRGLF
jgi:hypothetical protein